MFKSARSRGGKVKKLRWGADKKRSYTPRSCIFDWLESRIYLDGMVNLSCPPITDEHSPVFIATMVPAPTTPVIVPYTTQVLTEDGGPKTGQWTFTPDSPTQEITLKDIDPSLWGRNHNPHVNDVVSLNLTLPSGVTGNDSAIATIAENTDPPTLSISGPSSVVENLVGTFTVSLSGASSAVTVGYSVWNGTGGGITSGSLPFAVGVTVQTFGITAHDDHLWSPVSDAESMSVSLSPPTGVGGATSFTSTLAEDNDTPTVNVSGPGSVLEGQPATYTVNWVGDLPETSATVTWSVSAGEDLNAQNGSVTFTSTSLHNQTFQVQTTDDNLWPGPAGESPSIVLTIGFPNGVNQGSLPNPTSITEDDDDFVPPTCSCSCSCSCQSGDGSDPQNPPNTFPATGAAIMPLATMLGPDISGALPGALPFYSSRAADPDWGNGYGWTVSTQATVQATSLGRVVVFDSDHALWFNGSDSGGYTAQFGAYETLAHSGTQYLLTEPDGTVYTFNDLSQNNPGAFVKSVAPGGATTVVTNRTAGNLTIDYKLSTSGSAYEEIQYTYLGSGNPNAGHVAYVTLLDLANGSLAPTGQVHYTYYTSGANNGLLGDLELAAVEYPSGTPVVGSSTGWTSDASGPTAYFRYYTTNSSSGFQHGLERALTPVAYSAACAFFAPIIGSLDNITNDYQIYTNNNVSHCLADFTCYYFTYDANQRVSGETVYGQTGTWGFSTYLSDNANGYDNWYRETIDTEPNGNSKTVYTNYVGETLLTDVYDPTAGTRTVTYNHYDANDHLSWTAQPSAFPPSSGYYNSNTYADLIDYVNGSSPYLSTNSGLFDVYQYYASTDHLTSGPSDPGGVLGYLKESGVQQGTGGTPVYQSYLDYISDTFNSVTAYFTNSSTQYQSDSGGGSSPETTSYSYVFYTSGVPCPTIEEEITTLPSVSNSQNGSGVSATQIDWYNANSQLQWQKDERGSVSYFAYDTSGNMTETIQDIGYTAAQNLGVPSALSPASGYVGIAAETDYAYDSLGRVTQTLGPAHVVSGTSTRTASWTVYDDVNHQQFSAQGWAVETSPGNGNWTVYSLANPISIDKQNFNGEETDQIQAAWGTSVLVQWGAPSQTGSLSAFLAANTLAQTNYVAWTTFQYSHTHLASTCVYYLIPASGSGTGTANYNETDYGYESDGYGWMGRRNMVKSPDGTISRLVFDARGNVTSTWVGTNDTGWTDSNPGGWGGGNNMVEVSSSTFDADRNLISTTSSADSSDSYTTYYQYDWRDRQVGSLGPDSVATMLTLDNLDEVTESDTYGSATYNTSTHQISRSSGNLRAKSVTSYDPLGRAYESDRYNVAQAGSVSPAPGTIGDYLPSYTWYDAAGNVIKTQTGTTGSFVKYMYDGLGRMTTQYVGYDPTETTSELYGTSEGQLGLNNDTILQQTQTWYDAASEGVATATYEQFAYGTPVVGPLSGADSYTSASVTWYDSLGRTVAGANLGRKDSAAGSETRYFFNSNGSLNAASDGLPSITEQSPLAPNSSNNYIATAKAYDCAGNPYQTTDNTATVTETLYDAAGRMVIAIQNYVAAGISGTISVIDSDSQVAGKLLNTDMSEDVTTKYDYDANGRLATMVAYNATGSGSVGQQATKYVYGSAVNASWQTAVIYPDSTDTVSGPDSNGDWSITSGADHTSTTYDWLGRVQSTTDQNDTSLPQLEQRGVTHTYTYDPAGRLMLDSASIPTGSIGVDQSVLSIGTSYDDLGRVQFVTSYPNADGTGTPVNQVEDSYDGWGNLAQEWQSHAGAVSTSSTPSVQYTYADGATSGKAAYLRLTDVIYPKYSNGANGRDVSYGYGTAGAVDDIMSRLAAISDSTGTLAAYTYLGVGTIVKEQYSQAGIQLDYDPSDDSSYSGLDRFGRVHDQFWASYGSTPSPQEEYRYTYDRGGNVTARENVNHEALTDQFSYDAVSRLTNWKEGSPLVQQRAWQLDSMGNDWNSGSNYNSANEETPTLGSSLYDTAGDMVTLQSGDKAKYDAWGRMVEVDGPSGNTLETCQYDGTGRRIQVSTNFSGSTPGMVTDDYYSGQQIVESDITTSGSRAGGYQYVWSPRYIDAPIVRDTLNTAGTAIDSTGRLYYLGDANYNVTAIVKYDSGAGQWQVKERYSYDPYGKLTAWNSAWTTSSSTPSATYNNTVLYTGRELDLATGLFYYRARYYDAGLERFVSRDPMGYKGGTNQLGFNLYEYVGDSPVWRVDQSGLGWWSDCLWGYSTCTYTATTAPKMTQVGAPYVSNFVWAPIPTPLGGGTTTVIWTSRPLTPADVGSPCEQQWGSGQSFTKTCFDRHGVQVSQTDVFKIGPPYVWTTGTVVNSGIGVGCNAPKPKVKPQPVTP